MRLGDKQRLFARLVADLLYAINAKGYHCTLGDAYRDGRVHGDYGAKGSYSASLSNHKLRLAIDLNIFDKDLNYITDGEHPIYKDIGAFWEGMHELCEWGGSGNRGDANHFSLFHNGRW